ncbi:ATP-grasp domain-containing protein [Thomasclavelia sp.]|uniref:ATP-grasp domain-containing protein n=1 Tax=Thomasclavelia sp. TaxID=3025757 RepID=UPI0025D98FC6|nr:ATP-grasp domain-containing protein [Thomasclavelia sp.]
MAKDNILIFPAGTEISFEIFNALKNSKFVTLFGGTSIDDHSLMVYERIITGFPFVDDPDFIPFLNKIIDKYDIDYVYPAHDSVVMNLTENREKINANIITTELETVEICRSKEKTYKYLKDENFIPEIYSACECKKFPVFLKPKVGQGSKGARIIWSKEELKIYYTDTDIICEYLPGEEITVDCYTGCRNELKVISPRSRLRIRNGIAVKSENIKLTDEIRQIAEIINSRFKFLGAWFFQLKRDSADNYKLLEISPRIPGTMGLSRNRGINFPLLSIYANKGIDCSIITNDYSIVLDRAFINRYKLNINYNKVYVDLDDTLIINEKINVTLMSYLYQCINKNISIFLLTRHAKNVDATLKKHKISKEIFENIYHIGSAKSKAEYIDPKNSIFIDDSFAERNDVKNKLGIYVFDIDMIECLIDWRK